MLRFVATNAVFAGDLSTKSEALDEQFRASESRGSSSSGQKHREMKWFAVADVTAPVMDVAWRAQYGRPLRGTMARRARHDDVDNSLCANSFSTTQNSRHGLNESRGGVLGQHVRRRAHRPRRASAEVDHVVVQLFPRCASRGRRSNSRPMPLGDVFSTPSPVMPPPVTA